MIKTNELTEEGAVVNEDRPAAKPVGIGEYVIPEEGVMVRYTRFLPDKETFHDLIDDGKKTDIPPYLSAVFIHMDETIDVTFGNARNHYEIVLAVEHEKGRKVGQWDWSHIQMELDKESGKLKKISMGGFGNVKRNLMLLLGRINPQLFVPQEVPISIWGRHESYVYDPLSRELKEEVEDVAPGKTVLNPLGKVKPLY